MNTCCCCQQKTSFENHHRWFHRKIFNIFLIDWLTLLTGFLIGLVTLILSFNVLHSKYGHSHGSEASEHIFDFDTNKIIQLILYLVACLILGWNIFLQAARSIIKFQFNEATLAIVAVLAAFVINEYVEAWMIFFLFQIGQLLEQYVLNKTDSNIINIINLNYHDKVNLKEKNGNFVTKNACLAKVHDTVLLSAGDKVALDVIVTKGQCLLNAFPISDHSQKVKAIKGTKILSGSLILEGQVECKVLELFENSTATKIIDLIKNYETSGSKTEKFITKFAKIYTPVIIILAILITTIPLTFDLDHWINYVTAGLSFLLASCPCAFIISIPLAYFSAIANASRNEVIIKGDKFIDMLSRNKTFLINNNVTFSKYFKKLSQNKKLKVNEIINLNNKNLQSYQTKIMNQSNNILISNELINHQIIKEIQCFISFLTSNEIVKNLANIIILNDDWNKVIYLIAFCQRIKRLIWFNVIFVLTLKILILIAILLITFLSPNEIVIILGLLGDIGLTLLVSLNSLRILKFKFQKLDFKKY